MLTAICITLIILSILTLTIISEARVKIDLYAQKSISFFLFGIKVIKIDLEFLKSDEQYKFELRSNRKLLASVNLNEVKKEFLQDALRNALPNPFYNLDIVEVDAFVEYGSGNAFSTAMVSSALEKLLYGVLMYVLSKQRLRFNVNVQPNFDRRAVNLNLSGIFCITIADIIYGIIFSKKGEKKDDIGK